MQPVKVDVEWSSDKLNNLPKSGVYSTVAKFPEDKAWPSDAWSIVLEIPVSGNSSEIFARFLMPNAPWNRLKPGCKFELYEGFKLTAKVTVL